MTILLIDDQPSILSALLAGIQWHKLGITSILTANSAAKARRILADHSVDIVVSDIEMPNEDGLSLLSWSRENGYNYECILLTSHADFFYAKQAITLNVFDYLVQPARFDDISRAVENAIKKIQESKKRSDSTQQLNDAANNIVIHTMLKHWPDFEKAEIYPNELEERLAQLHQFGITCTECTQCLIVSICCGESNSSSPEVFLSACKEYFEKLQQIFRAPGISCIEPNQRFLIALFVTLPPSSEIAILNHFNNAAKKYGVNMFAHFTSTELRFLKNALNDITAHQMSPGCHSGMNNVHFNPAPLLASVSGRNPYGQYRNVIRAYILEHIAEPISRQDIAKALHLSADHVSVIVKTTENMTVKELINSLKMSHARKMLQNTKIPIGEVARKCGYDSSAYFSKIYRETFNITPTQERASFNKNRMPEE